MPDINSIADKLALLATEISNIKTEINRTHPGWATPEQNMSDIADDVDEMFIGFDGFYHDASVKTAYIGFSIIHDNFFNGYKSQLEYLSFIPGSGASFNDIEYIGEYAFKDTKIRMSALPTNLTHIGDYGLYNCTNLTISSLPNNLEYIGEYGLAYNSNMTLIDSQNQHVLPEGLEYLGTYAFRSCSGCTFNYLPSTLKHIGSNAFNNTTASFSGTLSKDLEYIGNSVFSGANIGKFTGNVPKGLTYIGQSAFKDCSSMTMSGNIFADDDVSDTPLVIKDSAFEGCSSLAIGGNAHGRLKPETKSFYNCQNIKFAGPFPLAYEIFGQAIPEGVFYYCKQLAFEQDTLTQTSIGSNAFYYCEKIKINKSIEVSGGIGSQAFRQCSNLVVSDKITASYIDYYAFYKCTGIAVNDQINCGSGSIGNQAFKGCTSLLVDNKIIAGNIGISAFDSCTSLKATNGIELTGSIGQSAFFNCSNLIANNKIECKGSIGANAFKSCTAFSPSVIRVNNCDSVAIGNQAFTYIGNLGHYSQDHSFLIDLNGYYDTMIEGNAFYNSKALIGDNVDVTIRWTSLSSYSAPKLSFGTAQIFSVGSDPSYGIRSLTFEGNMPILNGFGYINGLTTINFDPSTEELGRECFHTSWSLVSLTLPYTLKRIGEMAFYSSNALTTLVFEEHTETTIVDGQNVTTVYGVEYLGPSCFSGPNAANVPILQGSITFPASLKTIESKAFYLCNQVTNWYFKGTPTSIASDAFDSCSGTIHVPWNQGDVANFPGTYPGTVDYGWTPS